MSDLMHELEALRLAMQADPADEAALVHRIDELVERTVRTRDQAAVGQIGAGLERLLPFAPSATVADALERRRNDADRSYAALRRRHREQADQRDQQTLRTRIVELLRSEAHPQRPQQIADALGTDAFQVSRALRDLIHTKGVERVRPEGAHDRRARFYTVPRSTARAVEIKAYGQPGSCRIGLRVDGTAIWEPTTAAAQLLPDLLLASLQGAWHGLFIDAALPPEAPTLEDLRAQLRRTADTAPSSRDGRLPPSVRRYAAEHDLARALALPGLPPVLLVRRGLQLWVVAADATCEVDAGIVQQQLRELVRVAHVDGRDIDLPSLDDDHHGDPRAFVERLTGMGSGDLDLIAGDLDDAATWELSCADALIGNELTAVARMAGHLAPTAVHEVLDLIRSEPPAASTRIDALADGAPAIAPDDKPYAQGHALAAWLRQERDVDADDPFDVTALLDELHVRIRRTTLPLGLEALAVWGTSHGPTIWLSSTMITSRERTTLAHELCHVLVDRRSSLPLAEVLGGQIDAAIEQRARAFAAELLLPRATAARALRDATTEADAERDLANLRDRFRVSTELAALQVHNSDVLLPPAVLAVVRRASAI